jgi:hypothetical protein
MFTLAPKLGVISSNFLNEWLGWCGVGPSCGTALTWSLRLKIALEAARYRAS